MKNSEDYYYKRDNKAQDISYIKTVIKNWKGWYCRKNASADTVIRLRCVHPEQGPWDYYIEVQRGGNVIDQRMISEYIYNSLKQESAYEVSSYTGVEFVPLVKKWVDTSF